jgi:uncharacterized protein
MIETKGIKYISEMVEVSETQVKSVVEMLEEGMTVPFISRYRKEKTGSLDEVKVQGILENFEYIKELSDRKKTILKTIEEQGKLNKTLKEKIENTFSKTELEDLYLPFKPKRRTKAVIAKEKGLQPLALAILEGSDETLKQLATPFVNPDKKVESIEDALLGASHIIAEMFGENTELRKKVRKFIADNGILEVNVLDEFKDKRTKFEQYYDFSEKIKGMPSHRFLAIRRGEKEKILKTKITFEKEVIFNIATTVLDIEDKIFSDFLKECARDSLNRLILPSIELDIRMEMKKEADIDAISVFASNLENLLLAPPAGNIAVLGVDPGFRTGCKIVALSETGKLLDTATIFPTKPFEKTEEAAHTTLTFIQKYNLQAVVIGNGTASRETNDFMKKTVPNSIIVTVVSEAGASVYSASEAGREEFPDYDLTVRGAISIGRRFQDPLAELVKIEPKSIGVGQYQHDVSQSLLKKKLDTTVVLVVNRVGVDINTASYHLLKYVAGIGQTLAKNIVAYRDENGKFSTREQLKNVRMFGEKAFLQSAGFLRIREGENPLDKTGIHPESYFIVEKIANKLNTDVENLIGNSELIDSLNPKQFVTENFGIPTIKDILKELKTPGRDPRNEFELFEFKEGVEEISDLTEGMVLKGIVTNVTNFGAFVDIGVHQDGLVHISQLSHTYISSPEEVVSAGDKVKVKVVSIDTELKRIGLSIKALQTKPNTKHKRKQNKFTASLQDLQKKWNG